MKCITLGLPTFDSENSNASYSFPDLTACFLLCIVISVTVLCPDPLNNFTIASRHFTPLSLLLPVMLVVSICYIFSRRKLLNFIAIDIAVLMFMAYLLARNVFNPAGLVAIKYVVYGIGILYTTALVSRQRKPLLILIYLIVILSSLTAVYGLFEYALQNNFLHSGAIPQPPSEIHRLGSTLAHPVIYGAFLVQIIPFCILVLIQSKGFRQHAFGITTSIWTIEAIFLTYSKGSWIVVTIMLIVSAYILLVKGHYRLFVLLAGMLIFLVLLTGIFWYQTNSEISQRASQSIIVRSKIWTGTVEAIQDNYLTGVGLRNGNREIIKYIDNQWLKEWLKASKIVSPTIDNYYLSLFLEGGIVGFILWLGVVSFLLYGSFKAFCRSSQEKALIIAAAASLIGISINALTFDALLMWPHYVFFWLAAGILRGTLLRDENTHV